MFWLLSLCLVSAAHGYVIISNDVPFLTYSGSAPLLIVPGGNVSHLHLQGTAKAEVVGGYVAHLNAQDFSEAIVSSGEISHVRLYDGARGVVSTSVSHVTAMGSWVSNGFDPGPANVNSHLNVTGGTFWTVNAWGSGITDVNGGTMQITASDYQGTVNIHSGTVTEFVTARYGVTNIYGGSIASVWSDISGEINIYGGLINGIRDAQSLPIRVGDVHVYGRNLNYSGILGDTLTGFLSDGSIINAPVTLGVGRLHLHSIPEPATTHILIILLIICGKLRVSRC